MNQITSWETLLEVAHPLAKEKGWWDDMDRPIDEQVANFHAEISEAWEEYRAKRMETWYSSGGVAVVNVVRNADGCPGVISGGNDDFTPAKPEGFWVEIADLLVRLADTCGRYGWKPAWDGGNAGGGVRIAAVIDCLHACISDICVGHGRVGGEVSRRVEEEIEQVTSIIQAATTHHGVDLWPIVNEKVAYNRTRPHRHGGKVA